MNAHALVLSFAVLATVAATQTPAAELAAIVAVEEQERDLAKAEAMYREALAGKALSAEARTLANLRLGELLHRLGRTDDAKPFLAAGGSTGAVSDLRRGSGQDAERDKALREKAHEVVKQVLETNRGGVGPDTVIHGLSKDEADQLLWLGQAAVPEAIAALEGLAVANGFDPRTIQGLGAFLWRVGGRQGADFLGRARDIPRLAPYLAHTACSLRNDEMELVAIDYLRHANEELAIAVLDGTAWGAPLATRLDHATIIDVLGRGAVAKRERLLRLAPVIRLEPAAIPAFVAVIRAALASSEPRLGAAAQQVIGLSQIAGSTAGTELLFEVLPQLPPGLDYQEPNHMPEQKTERTSWRGRYAATAAARQVTKLDTCIRALGKVTDPDDKKVRWLERRILEVGNALDASAVPLLLAWWDLGYSFDAWVWGGKVTTENAAELFTRFSRVRDSARNTFLACFEDIELPASMFAALRDQADALGAKWNERLGKLMPRTGNADAATWIRTAMQTDPKEAWTYWALLELGRRNRQEAVRAAMRESIETVPQENPDLRAALLLALLAMGDEPALQLAIANVVKSAPAPHPYAPVAPGKTEPRHDPITPLAYLLQREPQPPHGIPVDKIIGLLPAIAEMPSRAWSSVSVRDTNLLRVPDEVLVAGVAAGVGGTWGPRNEHDHGWTWNRALAWRIAKEPADGPLHRWFDEALRTRSPGFQVLLDFNGDELARVRPQLDALIAGDDADLAQAIVERLESQNQPVDFVALLGTKHQGLRTLALHRAADAGTLPVGEALRALNEGYQRDELVRYLGARVAVEAIPTLLGLLKDPEEQLRTRAAEALTRIRFFHEQQAHWDRVAKGLDASPASAAEKLLLQAKPGAPKEQRLLAIQSLGTLGVPEALPFLIEWTQDADATVQQAAKAAITQIHLHPRK